MKVATGCLLATSVYYGSSKKRGATIQPKMISAPALEYLGVAKILGIHSNVLPPIIGKTEGNKAGLQVQTQGNSRKIVNKVCGVLNPDFCSVLQAYGVSITRLELMEAPNYSGGHPNLRAAVDILQSEALESTAQRAI